MDQVTLGRELRRRRAAQGRTVASVATDAGLSVPYVANLENGRGNPTLSALARLAESLGARLSVTFGDDDDEPREPSPRFFRSARFEREVARLGEQRRAVLVEALAGAARAIPRELDDADWQRLLDAVVLILAHPAER
ncbi:helix-turn-helix domain-containing protein [Nonomuraea soli]|uniref:Transcriptional regulator with XRE-family HTH domain n=1 Tax=Nonomuraea soli TaxID=1032476 RepID=A0A7W0CFY9_9ACTN|nr:helix-turn-helix domain-containing protein [Nonomuraea soli]MBA2890487.1 transcriptional regulator with XRE-family HTH domain [Nonomuraea soli]